MRSLEITDGYLEPDPWRNVEEPDVWAFAHFHGILGHLRAVKNWAYDEFSPDADVRFELRENLGIESLPGIIMCVYAGVAPDLAIASHFRFSKYLYSTFDPETRTLFTMVFRTPEP